MVGSAEESTTLGEPGKGKAAPPRCGEARSEERKGVLGRRVTILPAAPRFRANRGTEGLKSKPGLR